MDSLKNAEKENSLSQDQHHEYADDVQSVTNEFIKKIDETLKNKEQEIMQV